MHFLLKWVVHAPSCPLAAASPPCAMGLGKTMEKRTTDLMKLVVRHTMGGAAYAVHDPLDPRAPNEVTSGSIFVFCPQTPGVGASPDCEIIPWVWVRPWADVMAMTAKEWLRLDQQVDEIQGGDLGNLCPTEDDYLAFMYARQYLVPRRCSDGTFIYEASLVLGAVGQQGAKEIPYKLPSKLARWMNSGAAGDLSHRVKKWHNAWTDSRHSLRFSSCTDAGDPMYDFLDGVKHSLWFSKGRDGKVGQAHLLTGDGDIDARPVVFMLGGPVDPFFGRVLSPRVQDHILGVSAYMMPLSRAGKQPGLPRVALSLPPHADPATDPFLTLEWSLEGACGPRMVLTLQGQDDDWSILALEKRGEGSLGNVKPERVSVAHFLAANRKPCYKYPGLDGEDVDLPLDVYNAMLAHTKEVRLCDETLALGRRSDATQWVQCNCGLWLNGPVQWADHWTGKGHKKNMQRWQ